MNKIRSVTFTLIFLTLLPISVYGSADDSNNQTRDCQALLEPDANTEHSETRPQKQLSEQNAPIYIIPSGRDADLVKRYQEYADFINQPGGVLDQLGIPRSKQIIEFMAGTDLNASISGTGAKPVAHYLDGSSILKAFQNPQGLVFEVVYPGPNLQHGFYRDDNPFEQQISIINHVVGHNHFAMRSLYPHYRAGHAVDASEQLSELLQRLYQSHDKDEVQRFYLYLQSISMLQDFHTSYYQSPEEFEPKSPEEANPNYSRDVQYGRKGSITHPRSPTENVFQAVIANLPPDGPKWKREVAELVRIIRAYQPSLVHTQVMNEGWASFMQELVIKYAEEYNTFEHMVDGSKVMETGVPVKLQNPYSLGVSAWRRLYEKFLARPEIKELNASLAKDKAFVEYADGLISSMGDFEFLRLALDQTWVARNKLALMRVLDDKELEELGGNLPPQPPSDKPLAPYVVTSRDYERVVDSILRNVVFAKTKFRPRIQLNDFNGGGRGYVELKVDDDFGNKVPMDVRTLSPTLFVFAQVMGRTVSIEAMLKNPDYRPSFPWDPFAPMGAASPGHWWDEDNWEEGPTGDQSEIIRVRTEVSRNGEIRVYRVSEEDGQRIEKEVTSGDLLEKQKEYLHAYIEDLFLEDDEALMDIAVHNPDFQNFAHRRAIDMTNEANIESLFDHSPSVAPALLEYQTMIQRRMLRALERSLSGKAGLKRRNGRLMLKALPSVVNFQFDDAYLQKVKNETPTHPIDIRLTNQGPMSSSSPFHPDDGGNGQIVPTDGDTGSIGWGPAPPDGGEGEGEGKEPGEGEPGEEANDPAWIEIPEDLYNSFLGEKVKLPNLNPKKGKVKSRRKELKGRRNRRDGVMRADDTAANILKKGIAASMSEGNDPFDDPYAVMERGLNGMRPHDFVVKDTVPAPKPDTNAVVTFVLDGSGSTWAWYKTFQRFVADMKAVIQHNYKSVEFRFIIFDTKAHLMPDEQTFFKTKLGGGTDYSVGIEASLELYRENYPRNQWDRFTFVLGDLGDSGLEKFAQKLDESLEETEFTGIFRGGWGTPQLIEYSQSLKDEHPFFGYTDIGESREYDISHLRELLKNEIDN